MSEQQEACRSLRCEASPYAAHLNVRLQEAVIVTLMGYVYMQITLKREHSISDIYSSMKVGTISWASQNLSAVIILFREAEYVSVVQVH